MGDQLRVDRASVQQHTDDTRGNMGSFRGQNDDVDRRQATLQNQMENGVGSEDQERVRTTSGRHTTDIDNNVNRLSSKTSENADEFISNVRNAASKSFNTIQ
ncbi:hypothetical protein [Aeromicrobium sp.]|uniref:hypothetical protein n=1 Tax=Aeromicrobium sp. TaxID=1871063 RepID=UPI0030C12DAB